MACCAAVALLGSAACGSGFDDSAGDAAKQSSGPATLQILIGSSGDAETKAVKDAAAAWATSSRATPRPSPPPRTSPSSSARPSPAATRRTCSTSTRARFADYASVGALEPYGDKISNAGRLLREPAHRVHLRRQVLLRAEGLLHPRPADQHRPVDEGRAHRRRRADHLGRAHRRRPRRSRPRASCRSRSATPGTGSAPSWCRTAGGWISKDGKQPTADTPENLQALQYVKTLLTRRLARYPKQLDAGWAGEAFGKGKAAMTIEGNWIKGAMQNGLPRREVQGRPSCPPARRARAPCRSPTAGASRRSASHKDQAIGFVEAMTAGGPADGLRQGVRRDALPPVRPDAVHQASSRPTRAFIDGAGTRRAR